MDLAGGDNTGTAVGGAAWSSSGLVGGCISLDGSDDAVNSTPSNLANGWTGITVAAWVYVDSWGNWDGIVVSRGSGIKYVMLNLTDDRSIAGYFNTKSFTRGEAGKLASNATWYHVAITWSSGQPGRAYVDGTFTLRSDTGQSVNTGSLEQDDVFRVGNDDYGGRFLGGAIDDVRIYNRALSADEIHKLYVYRRPDVPAPDLDVAGAATFREQVEFLAGLTTPALGDISMGSYTNRP